MATITLEEVRQKAREFLALADDLNELVSAYIDGSDRPEAERAYKAVIAKEREFCKAVCIWDEGYECFPCLNYELAEAYVYDPENE